MTYKPQVGDTVECVDAHASWRHTKGQRLVVHSVSACGYYLRFNARETLEQNGCPAQRYRVVQPASAAVAASATALTTQVGGGHYKDCAIQPVEFIHANGLNFIEGCVVKYVSRWRKKGGIQDLKKARHFLDMLIELEGKTPDPTATVTA
ncbi:DUF3310 domain-containing protein [Caulobacter sp.]|uniref:DUF3310 domain-containing protein n=1 Tax=Caulobacter sp. TaxID=78 RepID=UPI0031D26491